MGGETEGKEIPTGPKGGDIRWEVHASRHFIGEHGKGGLGLLGAGEK